MINSCLRLRPAMMNYARKCKKAPFASALLLLLFLYAPVLRATVTVTPATGGTGICSNKAATGSAPGYSTLGPIVITEGTYADFSTGTDVIVLQPPTGWQFGTTTPTVTFITGSNIVAASASITSSALTVNVTVTGTTGADQFTISGLQVQPNTTTAPTANVFALTTTGITGISAGSGGTNMGTLSVTSPLTASVSISASPSGSFCPGTNVTFTPAAVNGGTPTYTWAVNGADVSIGTSFSTTTLASGNTVSCRMSSSLGCLVTNPVHSNTITASVLTAPAAITGIGTTCPGVTTTFSTTSTGGAWSSSSTSIATVNSAGVVTGVAAGTSTISYTAGGCSAKKIVYVDNPPFAPALTPTATAICNGTVLAVSAAGSPASSTVLSQDFNAGLGSWTVDTTGSIAVFPGSEWKACADSYLNEQGWYRSPDHTTFAMANADTSGSSSTLSSKLISPIFSLADYAAATLSFQHSYDYWASGDVYVNLEISTDSGATWTTIHNFSGAGIGGKMSFASASYSLNAYVGHPYVQIRFYYYSTFGYYWAIDNILITGVSGIVTPTWSPVTNLYTNSSHTTAYTTGTPASTVYVYNSSVSTPVAITYTATSTTGACATSSTSTVTINPSPGTTSGALNVCAGTTTTLTNSAAGGTWVSGNTSIATVGSTTGIVTGVTAGTVLISYVSGGSCSAISTVTVNSAPAAITGSSNVCMGYTATLSDATTGGTWSSSNPSVATIDATTGVVSSVSTGTTVITYSLGVGCVATRTIAVQPVPAAITGSTPVCAGQTMTLSCITSGGLWSTGGPSVASVDVSSGVVTGVAGGTTHITYIFASTGCFSTTVVTINPIGPITGPANACIGYTVTLGNVATGGTWTSSNLSAATIDASSGNLTGIAVGTTTVSYVTPFGCSAGTVITVNTLPSAISGASSTCAGGSTILTNPTGSGTWSSSNTAIMSIGATTGITYGASAGTVTITYTASTSCIATHLMTVNPLPAAITGSASICESSASMLSNATGSGTWSSSSSTIAPITSGGEVSGATPGTATITYTLPTGCFGTRPVTVNPLPGAISGTMALCQGTTVNVTTTSTGGTWSSSNTGIASIGSTTGIILGGASGTAYISYTLPTTCYRTATVTVNPIPSAVSGANSVCTGSTIVLTSSTPGGSWSSGSTSTATIGTGGVVSGVASGTVVMSYIMPTGCFATKTITVNASPAAITGTASVCQGQQTTLGTATSGGVWSSSNTSVANVGSATGQVTGVSAGMATISYLVSSGCVASRTVTVLPLPGTISGDLSICLGATSTLGNSVAGGTWSSSAATVTITGTDGVATGASLGSATITYTLPTGCYNTATAVVNPLPAAITGASAVCAGSATTLTNTSSGGTWSSSSTGTAGIGVTSGTVSGITAGTTTISYRLPTGCSATRILTVNPLPTSISGTLNICETASATLSSTPAGGTWFSNIATVATIGATSGIAYGVGGGATIISYTLPTGCYVTQIVTVTSLPSAITGTSAICQGSSSLFSDVTSGGSWSTSNSSIASIGSSTGLASAVSPGTAIVTYQLPVGCIATKSITVNPVPLAIGGPTALCVGSPVTMTDASAGGAWSSGSPTVASIGASTGLLTGVLLTTAVISYTLPTGCYTTTTVTVNLTPSAITGTSAICEEQSTTFTNSISGGSWTSSNSSVATAGASTGVISGISAGSTTITYQLASGCYVTKSATVNPVPDPISGPSAICQGHSATLSSSPGGTWISGNTFVAPINSSTGVVTGASPGICNITYTYPTGCKATETMTVYALPSPLSGPGNACLGNTITLSTSTPGGSWSSTDAGIATVDPGGIVSGISLGTATISYALGAGCSVNKTVTVQPLPPAIAGNTPTCAGVSITLSNAVTGGTWSSGTPGVASINASSGVVTPIAAGTTLVSYTAATGCAAMAIVTVNSVPDISGSTSLCVGSISHLSHSTPGGTWSSSNTSVAGIGSASGIVVGYAAGLTATVSYTMPGGCIATKIATVNSLPSAITGASNVCPAFTITLSDGTAGGTWSSSNTSIATIGSASGLVTGVTSGLVTMSYTLPSGCAATKLITVNALPAAISGVTEICGGSTTTLSSGAPGGTWSSGNTAIAYASPSSGIITGVSPGTVNITYTPTFGCTAIAVVTVNPAPSPITGFSNICNGQTGTLSNSTAGGTWTSSNPGIAAIDAGTGDLTAIATGITTISYATGPGCAATRTVTVNTMPDPISGPPSVCAGYTATFNCTPAGGTWTSSSAGIANINASTGILTGIGAGTTTISYGFASGCRSVKVVTVSPVPTSISGTTIFCEGDGTTLSDPLSGGGTWSSSNPFVATAEATSGLVSGISAGTATITYAIGTGCQTLTTVTVNPIPTPISGVPNACLGMMTVLSNTTTGGTWASNTPAVAAIGSTTGVVTGVTLGTAFITYRLPTGCYSTLNVSVNAMPGAISGPSTVCAGSTIDLSDPVSGGLWSSGTVTVATVNATTGTVSGISAGLATITYAPGAGCYTTYTVSVHPLPAAISGATAICRGSGTILSSTTSGGLWTSDNPGVADIDGLSGAVTSSTPGTTTIAYTISTGCRAIAVVTVHPLMPTTGTAQTCVGFATTLSNSVSGGTWISSSTAVATVGTASGSVSGISPGTATITYSLPTGCKTYTTVTVQPLYPVSGSSTVCAGQTTSLANAGVGGTWTSGDAGIAAVDGSTGIVTGVLAGSTTITYTYGNGCFAVQPITVNALSPIAGPSFVCQGLNISLTDATPGGTWSCPSTNASISATGILTGVTPGTVTVSYTLPSGCTATRTIAVNALAATTGPATVCSGSQATLSNTVAGGSWTSGNTAVATIGTSGTLTGVSPGAATIYYNMGTGCNATYTMSVLAVPATITGSTNICVGAGAPLTSGTTGGTWTSATTTVATVGSGTGIVTGIAPGTSNITYTIANGCFALAPVTVNPLPAAITGTSEVCVGSSETLADATTGGTWSSANTAIAVAGSSTGIYTGTDAGTVTITYTLSTGCRATRLVTVYGLPLPISGPTAICEGASETFTNPGFGGTWSSSGTTATVGSLTGIVTGVTAGTAYISYTLPTGCSTFQPVVINPLPGAIGGATQVCAGLTATLTDASPGGTWSAADGAVAAIDATSGLLTGLAAGTTTVSYTLSTGCYATTVFTVNPLPGTFSGSAAVCQGLTSALSSSSAGGTWTSGASTIASVGSTGIVTGLLPGLANITYTLPTGCLQVASITVNPLPAAITGTVNVCAGLTTALADATPGGSWSSSAPTTGSIDAMSGVVTGVSSGTITITYTLATGCISTTTVTVNHTPATVSGPGQVCTGSTITLSSSSPGGTWTSSSPGVASVSASGVVSGHITGTTTISYTLPTGCQTVSVISVNPVPPAITGAGSICPGSAITVYNSVSGGTWNSSDPTAATVDMTSGLVMGIASGLTVITYILPTGCKTNAVVIVNPLPDPITGSTTTCQGMSSALSCTSPGGTWGSSNPAIATVGVGTGSVNGISPGTAVISYALSTGCVSSSVFTVQALPPAITGPANACLGANTTLSNAETGGTWSSGATAVATVGATSGIVTGVSLGIAAITYTAPSGCRTSRTVTVQSLPAAVSGTSTLCLGNSTVMSCSTPGGTWSSSDATVANIDSASGYLTTSGAGTATIYYTVMSGCYSWKVVTVNAIYPISGSSTMCKGDTLLFTDAASGGTWSSSTLAVATVSPTGQVYAADAGVTVISYSMSGGCLSTRTLTVNALPVVFTVTGGGSFCIGGAGVPIGMTGSTASIDYQLYLGGTPVHSVSGTGGVISFGSYTTAGTYTVVAVNPATGCMRTQVSSATVTPVAYGAAAVSISSSGGDTVCAGTTVTYSPVTFLAGSSPTFHWYVNGSLAGSASSYAYSPVTGDTVKCYMNSSAACASPDTASDAITMTVLPMVTPLVSVSVSPGDTLCAGNTVTFTAYPGNGGTAPLLLWTRNGSLTDTGHLYTYAPASGDVVYCSLVSNARCRTADTINSASIHLTTLPYNTPSVTINATPGFTFPVGTTVTFNALVSGAGATPTYQWAVNGVTITGATADTYTSSSLADGDTISCSVTSSGRCGGITTTRKEGIITTGVGVSSAAGPAGSLAIYPNPNEGNFIISGYITTTGGQPVNIRITDMLGRQVLYRQATTDSHGSVDIPVTLAREIANGMYTATITYENRQLSLHFVVKK